MDQLLQRPDVVTINAARIGGIESTQPTAYGDQYRGRRDGSQDAVSNSDRRFVVSRPSGDPTSTVAQTIAAVVLELAQIISSGWPDIAAVHRTGNVDAKFSARYGKR